jgi:hypothetical protein
MLVLLGKIDQRKYIYKINFLKQLLEGIAGVKK